MIEVNDILLFIRQGFPSDLVQIGMPVVELKRRFGEPTSTIGDIHAGYLFYKYIRFGYSGDHVDQIALIFEGTKNLRFDINSDILEGVIDSISGDTKINKIIQVLNCVGIKWNCQYKKTDLN